MSVRVGRNQLCPCGSQLKYKKCHGAVAVAVDVRPTPPFVQQMIARHAADEQTRREQQGLGRPILSFKTNGRRVVAVGNKVHWSTSWKTFPDFLADYLKRTVGQEWGNAELAKPFEQQHPLIQWYRHYCLYQQATIKTPGEPVLAEVTGIVACYLGLAYSLYLLDHNAELQKRLVNRLKNIGNFQGAYYELIVANVLIRAGFELILEDEADPATKHCEFAAISRETKKKYWVEAKMRSVVGFFGQTIKSGTTKTDPISQFIPHLNAALAKPANDERLIFIDLNTEPTPGPDLPSWGERAAKRLERYEKETLPEGTTAYIFVTNLPFHRMLDERISFAAIPLGLGIPDFNHPGVKRLSVAFKEKLKHIDAYSIGETLQKIGQFPNTFDGSMPSESFPGSRPRLIIGETYQFGDLEKDGLVGTVDYASVDEVNSRMMIAIHTPDGRSFIMQEPMSPVELADYQHHKDSYFGRVLPVGRHTQSPFELFEWFVETHRHLNRSEIIEKLSGTLPPNFMQGLSDEDLLYELCEYMVAGIWKPMV